jgi:hypothetical protein
MSTEALTTLPPAQPSLMDIVAQASASGANPDQLSALLKVKRDYEADEARKAFFLAVSEFQRRCPIIPKDDKAHNKQYARMDRIWRTIRPLLTELGLSVAWQVNRPVDGGLWQLEGQLRHKDGHAQDLVFCLPIPDVVSGQNKAQQGGSASTYAQRYGLCAALGIVTGDDDDGHAAGTAAVSLEQEASIVRALDACRVHPEFQEAKFWGWLGCALPCEIPATRYADVMRALEAKRRDFEARAAKEGA